MVWMRARSPKCSPEVNARGRTSARFAFALALALGAVSAHAQPVNPRELAEQVHAEGGYADELRIRGSSGEVREFPQQRGTDQPGLDARRFDHWGRGDASDRTSAPGARGQAPPPDMSWGDLVGGETLSMLLLIVVGALLIALVIVLVFALRSDRKDPPPVRRPAKSASARADELPWDVGDPDELAAQGRFSEAILAVLVGSLKVVGWQPRGERSRTAREVLWSIPATDARRRPLDEVVRRAERVRFAGDEATLESYREVREWGESVRKAAP